jgi:hypothetical protein
MRTTFAVLSAALVMAGCSSNKPVEQPPQGVQAQRIEAIPSVNEGGLRFSALVMPDSQVPLAFRIPGYVVSLKQVRGQDGRMQTSKSISTEMTLGDWLLGIFDIICPAQSAVGFEKRMRMPLTISGICTTA